MNGQKIIKVDMDLNVTIHDFPAGSIREQNHKLCDLIGNGCTDFLYTMPDRLYTELGHNDLTKDPDGKGVVMLIDLNYLYRPSLRKNPICGYLYENVGLRDAFLGNALFVGKMYEGNKGRLIGIEEEKFEILYAQLVHIATGMKQGLL